MLAHKLMIPIEFSNNQSTCRYTKTDTEDLDG